MQQLKIPTTEVEEEFINYTVKLGDTLYTIAQSDSRPEVAEAATNALARLNQQ